MRFFKSEDVSIDLSRVDAVIDKTKRYEVFSQCEGPGFLMKIKHEVPDDFAEVKALIYIGGTSIELDGDCARDFLLAFNEFTSQ